MIDFLFVWMFVGLCAAIVCLVMAVLAYDGRDRAGVRGCLKAVPLSLIWPISLPCAIAYGIYRLWKYGFRNG